MLQLASQSTNQKRADHHAYLTFNILCAKSEIPMTCMEVDNVVLHVWDVRLQLAGQDIPSALFIVMVVKQEKLSLTQI